MFKLLCFVVVLISIAVPQTWAQNPNGMPRLIDMESAGNPASFPPVSQVDPVRARMEMQAMQRESQDRQLELKRDTDKLLALATELKQNVDRTNPNILSMDVVKKAQEIEKLAKSVKDKMKGD
jgi:hypothetical protein